MKLKESQLKPAANNPRKIDAESAEGLKNSIARFGDISGIVWNSVTGQLVCGHQRIAALKKLGATFKDNAYNLGDYTFPVRVVEMTEEEERIANVTANNPFISGEYVPEALADLENSVDYTDLKELRLDALLEDLGLMESSTKEGNTDPDDVPKVGAKDCRVERGHIWQLGEHRLMCGDSTSVDDVNTLLDGKEITLCVTDPPYGVEYDPEWRKKAGVNKSDKKMGKVQNDDVIDWGAAFAIWNPRVLYCYHAAKYAAKVAAGLEGAGYEVVSQIIWAKDRFALSRGDYHWQHEPCWYVVKKGENHNWQGARDQSTLWEIKSREDGGHTHGTQKPVECMARPILNNSAEGDIVCDPFLGSGTTIMAAEQNGRICYGMEIDPNYCDVILKRWENFTGKKAEQVK